MKIKVSFVGNVVIEGGTVSKDDVIQAIEEWLDDISMGDQVVEYISDEYEFDNIEITVETLNVR